MRRAIPLLALATACAAAPPPAPPPVARIPVPPLVAAPAPAEAAPLVWLDEPVLPGDGLATLLAREIKLVENLHFETDRPDLRPESLPLLDSAAGILLARPRVTLWIACFSDPRGSPDHNRRLAQSRADAIGAYLVARGVAPERLVAKGFSPHPHDTDPKPRHCDLVRTDGP